MLEITLGCIIGILLGLYIDVYLFIVLYFLSIILLYFLNKLNICYISNKKSIVLLFVCIGLFFTYTKISVQRYDNKYKEEKINGTYTIVSYNYETNNSDKYICKNKSNDRFIAYFDKNVRLNKGDEVQIVGKYRLPDITRNTGGFNYRRYLNSQKIYGTIIVEKYTLVETAKFNLIYYIQDEINKSLSKFLPRGEMGLVVGMMIGETKDISEDVLDSFRRTGITHLIAVSGSNVMYVLICVQFIFSKIYGKRKSFFISIVVIVIFMLISGASSSVVRATIMAILTLLANILYKKSDVVNNILISAFFLLIINPLIVYDVGFILSFGGTIGIVLLNTKIISYFKKNNWLTQTIAITISAQIILIPIMAFYFNTISILSIIINIIVVPISGLITILGFIVFLISKIFFPLADFLSKSLYILSHFTIWISQVFSKISFVSVSIVTPNIFEIAVYYFCVYYLIIKKNSFNKKVAIILSIFILSEFMFYYCPKKYVELNFIDVGQGDAIFIKTEHNKIILIDGGGSDTYDVGKNILMPYLLNKRVLSIDAVFCSHSDSDHLNGLLIVLEELKVKKVFIAKNSLGFEKLYEIAKNKRIDIIELKVGDIVEVDGISFVTISPSKQINNKDINDYSLVLKMIYGSKSVLFTGDIGINTEKILQNVKADVLKVGHHGSNSSSSLKFISRVNPELSVIQVGKNNKFGHPNIEVLNNLRKYSKVITTADNGEIKLKVYKNKIEYE